MKSFKQHITEIAIPGKQAYDTITKLVKGDKYTLQEHGTTDRFDFDVLSSSGGGVKSFYRPVNQHEFGFNSSPEAKISLVNNVVRVDVKGKTLIKNADLVKVVSSFKNMKDRVQGK